MVGFLKHRSNPRDRFDLSIAALLDGSFDVCLCGQRALAQKQQFLSESEEKKSPFFSRVMVFNIDFKKEPRQKHYNNKNHDK